MKGVDVSHLEAGMRVTLVIRRAGASATTGRLIRSDNPSGGDRLSGTLISHNVALWTEGGILVRMPDGSAGPGVLEVLDPLPPVKLPVGTRKRSPNGTEAILTDEQHDVPWRVYYQQIEDGTKFLADDEVYEWEVITDTPPVPEGHVTIDPDQLIDEVVAWVAFEECWSVDSFRTALAKMLTRSGEQA